MHTHIYRQQLLSNYTAVYVESFHLLLNFLLNLELRFLFLSEVSVWYGGKDVYILPRSSWLQVPVVSNLSFLLMVRWWTENPDPSSWLLPLPRETQIKKIKGIYSVSFVFCLFFVVVCLFSFLNFFGWGVVPHQFLCASGELTKDRRSLCVSLCFFICIY